MPSRLIAGAVLLLVSLSTGCARTGDGEARGDQSGCDSPAVAQLGIPFRGARAAFFDTTGGDVFVGVSDLGDTVLGRVTLTGVDIGLGDKGPEIDPTSARVVDPVASVIVHLDRLSKVSLPAGRYWLVSSNGGRISVRTCPGVELSGVAPATAEPGASFTSKAPTSKAP